MGKDDRRGWSLEWWIPAAYAAVAGLWIYTSDALVAAIAGSMERQRAISSYKGFGFVIVTAALLHGVSAGPWDASGPSPGGPGRARRCCGP